MHQIDQAQKLGADDIELHTGEYANAQNDPQKASQLKRLEAGAIHGHEAGLKINAGHGLTYFNVKPVVALPYLEELNIGHSIIARAVYVGLHQAVIDMLALMD